MFTLVRLMVGSTFMIYSLVIRLKDYLSRDKLRMKILIIMVDAEPAVELLAETYLGIQTIQFLLQRALIEQLKFGRYKANLMMNFSRSARERPEKILKLKKRFSSLLIGRKNQPRKKK